MASKKRDVSANAKDTMRKIRILAKTIDLKISHLLTAEQCNEFYELVRQKELVSCIRKGGYCEDEMLDKMFKTYGIK